MSVGEASTELVGARPRGLARSWWTGRFGHRLMTEFLALFVLLTLYRFGRYLARGNLDAAFRHADSVSRLEQALGLATEPRIQQLLLDHLWVVRLLNRYYATVHFPATTIFLVLVYIHAPPVYRRLRNVLIGVTGVGLVIQMSWPLAPPRMMPGFVDTVERFGPTIYDKPGVASIANQYAAMPSLHVGWALIIAVFAVRAFRGPWRYLGAVHCAMTVLAVVGTANHWWLDTIAASALVLAALAVDTQHDRLACGQHPTLRPLAVAARAVSAMRRPALATVPAGDRAGTAHPVGSAARIDAEGRRSEARASMRSAAVARHTPHPVPARHARNPHAP